MVRIFLFAFFCFILFSQCKEANKIPKHRTEKLQVYTVKNENGEYVKDKMKFSEAFVYDEEGNKRDHFILDEDENIINKEKMMYDDNMKLIRSEYYSMFDSLLSYYTYEFPKANLEVKRSYDGANNELLRIEKIYINENGQPNKKELYSADENLQRVFTFKYDEQGNETYFSIMNALGERLRSEQFKISKMDDRKLWTERWGFEDDKPISCRIRTFGYANSKE